MAEKKPSGMEMMLMNMLRATGLDVNEIQANVVGFADKIKMTLAELGDRLATIDKNQHEQNERLARIEKALAISSPVNESDTPAVSPRIPIRKEG